MAGDAVAAWQQKTERELVRAAQDGDQEATEYLVVHHPPLQAVITRLKRQMNRDGRLHDDLESEGRVAALTALRSYDRSKGATFATYAYYPIRSAMLPVAFPASEYRRTKEGYETVEVVPTYDLEDDEQAQGWEAAALKADPDYGFEASYLILEERELELAVDQFLATLSNEQRELTRKIHWGGATHSAIAAAEGTTRPAITRRMSRVYARGARCLKDFSYGSAA